MKVEIYFDVVCPWCYIGERGLLDALKAVGAGDVEVVHRPFQLDPKAGAEAEPIAEYLARRFGAMAPSMTARVTEVGERAGIRFDWERALMANTMAAHRLVLLAGREYDAAVQAELVEGLFRAHFTEGRDVGSVRELASIAGSAGMDAERASAWLESGGGEVEVRDALAEARALGIQSVPTFVFDDRFALEGAQSVATFVAAIAEVRESSAPSGAGTEEA